MCKELITKLFGMSPEEARIALAETTLTPEERKSMESDANRVKLQREVEKDQAG